MRVPKLILRQGSATAYSRMRDHLRRLNLRALNDSTLAGCPPPTVEQLADALVEYVYTDCMHLVYFHEPGEPRLPARQRRAYLDGPEAVDRLCGWIARERMKTWTPAWITTKQANGTKAKGIPKDRPGIWDDPVKLHALSLLGGWTKREQAEFFEVSEETIKRGRRRLRGSQPDRSCS